MKTNDSFNISADWKLEYFYNHGKDDQELFYAEEEKNVITAFGRQLVALNLFGLAGSGTCLFLAAGSGNTAAAYTDTRLQAELIANGTRKGLLNGSGGTLTAANVIFSAYTDTTVGSPGQNYFYSVSVQATYNGASDLNVNQSFQEFALASVAACPATPTGTSGGIFNHYVAAAGIPLLSTVTLVVTVTLHF